MANIVTASINYTAPLPLFKVEKPFYSNVPAPDGRQSNQVAWTYGNIKFTDIRGNADDFDLDVNGFEVFQFGPRVEDESDKFATDAWIENEYYPVVERVLKSRLGDVDVVIFDHTVRRRRTASQLKLADDAIRATRQPSLSAHCGMKDETSWAACLSLPENSALINTSGELQTRLCSAVKIGSSFTWVSRLQGC
jgi:hypothetical protein